MRLGFKKGILIYLGALFLMSHIISSNVSAFDMILDYDNYESVGAYPRVNVNCNLNGTAYTNLRYCVDTAFSDTSISVRSIQSSDSIPVKAGDLITFDLLIFSPTNFTFSNGLTFVSAQVPNARVLGYKETFNDDLYNTYYLDVDPQSAYYGEVGSGNYISRLYTFYARANNDQEQFYPGLVSTSPGTYPIFNYYKGGGNGLSLKIININVLRHISENETNKEQEEKTQEAADESADVAEDNSESQQTDSIINVFGSFVSAVSSLQPTNCNVTLQWPSSLGGNMTVNVCQNKDKAGNIISVFGSITLIVFYIPLALKLLSMIYNEIRSFTSG